MTAHVSPVLPNGRIERPGGSKAVEPQNLYVAATRAKHLRVVVRFARTMQEAGRGFRRGSRDTIAFMLPSTDSSLHAALVGALASVPDIAFAIVFGSFALGNPHAGSDVDVALGFGPERRPAAREIGAIVSQLEEATGRSVDIIVLDHAPPGLAYRVFRDGVVVLARDRVALIERKVRAILEYLDFQPVERVFSNAVLAPRAQ